ncbi:MAG: hypothetical protein ABH816_01615 [Candidatus Levyibacteriota bacterium]
MQSDAPQAPVTIPQTPQQSLTDPQVPPESTSPTSPKKWLKTKNLIFTFS